MALPRFARPAEGRVIAGVCAGIAQALAVDVTLVRLVFALLALAGGAGILLYLALWSYGSSTRPWWALLVLAAGVLLLHAFGLSDRAVGGIALVATGLALVWRRRGTLRPDSPRAYAGLALAGLGVVLLLQG
jgi:phage shock protein PspC (stress-responsive transcriptional regulator)